MEKDLVIMQDRQVEINLLDRLNVFERFISLMEMQEELLVYASFNEDEDNVAAQQIIKECLHDIDHSLD